MIGIIVFRAIFKSFFTNCYLHKRILLCHNFPKSATHLSPIPRSNPCSFRGITHHSNWSKQWILYGLIPKKHDLYYWMKISRKKICLFAYEHWYDKIPATEKMIPETAKCR